MSKQCPGCQENVDAAKSFCPGCGHAFENEQARDGISGFDQMDSTVQMGQTMYNQLLSDMQLNVSKSPAPEVTELSPAASTPLPPASAPSGSNAATGNGARLIGGVLAAIAIAIALILIFYRSN